MSPGVSWASTGALNGRLVIAFSRRTASRYWSKAIHAWRTQVLWAFWSRRTRTSTVWLVPGTNSRSLFTYTALTSEGLGQASITDSSGSRCTPGRQPGRRGVAGGTSTDLSGSSLRPSARTPPILELDAGQAAAVLIARAAILPHSENDPQWPGSGWPRHTCCRGRALCDSSLWPLALGHAEEGSGLLHRLAEGRANPREEVTEGGRLTQARMQLNDQFAGVARGAAGDWFKIEARRRWTANGMRLGAGGLQGLLGLGRRGSQIRRPHPPHPREAGQVRRRRRGGDGARLRLPAGRRGGLRRRK